MDFKKSTVVLAMIVLCALKISCQVSLTRENFDPQDCIIERTVVILNCTVEDRNDGNGATIINGSQVIFDCPKLNTADDNKLFLRHLSKQSAVAKCGDLVSGQIVEVRNGIYTTQINITTNTDMNEGYVECREFGLQGSPRIQLANIKALPGLPNISVNFFDAMFCVHWSQSNKSLTQIAHYLINVTGEDCGNCTNLDRIVSSVTNQLSCTGWEPNGQVCNVTVTAVASVCDLQQFISSSRLIYLRVPEPPHLENLTPTYSYDLEELKSMQILLAVNSTVDSNGLPITVQVNVERSSSDNIMIPKCSFNISAISKCFANNAEIKYRCEINFTVSSCPQLLLQPEQDADYRIGIFTENIIGRSSLNANSNVSPYAHLRVQFLFTEPQQSQEYNYISISLPQEYKTVTFMIKYGLNCQALDNQTTIVGFNVTSLTFSIPGIMDDICLFVTINNVSQSIVIQGNFSIETLNLPSGAYNYSLTILAVSFALSILFIILFTPSVTWYIYKKYKVQASNSQPQLVDTSHATLIPKKNQPKEK